LKIINSRILVFCQATSSLHVLPRVCPRVLYVERHQLRGALFVARDERIEDLPMLQHRRFGACAHLHIQTAKTLNLFADRANQARQTPIAGNLGNRPMKANAFGNETRLIVRRNRGSHLRENRFQAWMIFGRKTTRGKTRDEGLKMLADLIKLFNFDGVKALNDYTLAIDRDESFLFEATKCFAHGTARQAQTLRDFALDQSFAGLELTREDGAPQNNIRLIA